ncbi:MAG TPA: YceI family protein [Casimicrobiaceae bacterium]|nr:YceI family protein [Casimicrobiaceae bacterium]
MTRAHCSCALTLAVAVPLAAVAAEERYVFDPVHSQPMCEVRHMGFSTQHVSFTKISGRVTLDREAHKGTLDATVDTTSVRSYSEKLDAHLKGEDFFDVAKYPTMTFKSSDLVFEGDRVVAGNGELTLLGVTKPVSFKVSNFVCGEQPFNKRPMCGAEVTATIMRSEWGMKYGIPKAASDEVRIYLPIEAFRE